MNRVIKIMPTRKGFYLVGLSLMLMISSCSFDSIYSKWIKESDIDDIIKKTEISINTGETPPLLTGTYICEGLTGYTYSDETQTSFTVKIEIIIAEYDSLNDIPMTIIYHNITGPTLKNYTAQISGVDDKFSLIIETASRELNIKRTEQILISGIRETIVPGIRHFQYLSIKEAEYKIIEETTDSDDEESTSTDETYITQSQYQFIDSENNLLVLIKP